MDPSYHFKKDESLADHEIGSRHIHFYIVLGGDALVTAVKEVGAANSFISSMVLNKLGWGDQVQPMTDNEAKNFTGMGG